MSEQEIYDKIVQLIEERFELSADKVSQSLDFKKDLNADSIDIVEFILELEDTFGAEISDEDAEKLATVGDAVTYIKNHQ
ncbi:acyl carrier protein [Loigolactobacillus coryniformis]|uniref:Acyl carrier protein n=1 Tax=Loigolactobacillus coryniformis TaxID=1610 RepID=A0A5B8TIE8_9LACO|nr:acyl carrier protein [Loigolactobacillus coryniformis]QEA53638.1 acyl carrier protein [Loigolactobacillus coryniformis]RRG05881.1 MAG: acyl carrier protein [Lactobacillus sp.]